MNAPTSGFLHFDITEKIIGAIHRVYGELGSGFSKSIYESALQKELKKVQLEAVTRYPISIWYEKQEVGSYYADIFVDGKVIIAVRAHRSVDQEDEKELINTLRASMVEVGLLANFGERLQLRRKVFSNSRKSNADSRSIGAAND